MVRLFILLAFLLSQPKYPKKYACNTEIISQDSKNPHAYRERRHLNNMVEYINDSTIYILEVGQIKSRKDTLVVHKHRQLVSKSPKLKRYIASDNIGNVLNFYEYIDANRLWAIAGEFKDGVLCVFILEPEQDL